MEAFLRGLLRELEQRCTVLRERLTAVPDDPDLRDHALSGYQFAEALHRKAAALLRDPSLGAQALLPNHLRAAQDIERGASLLESYFLPFLERYAEVDRRLTRLCRRLAIQVRWPGPSPLVLALSSQYYWTLAPFNLIAAPATEGTSLLRLPDLCHELGHILLDREFTALVGAFVAELAAYVDQERRRVRRGQRPPEYAALYVRLFVQWRDAWLAEFIADMVATYLVGPAFGWQHVRLCAASGQAAYSPALGETSTHPANEARLQGVRLVLDHLGAQAQGAAIQALWDSYVALSQQSRPPDYETCYPHALLESLARRVVDACRHAGLRAFGESAGAPDTAPDLPLLIGTAWEQFLALGGGYQDWERHQLAELWAALGFSSP